MKTVDCDVAIAGGGPAGAVAALALSSAGVPVVLLESSHYDRERVGETLPPRARDVLTRLGLWERFLATEPIPSFGNRSAWGGPEVETASFLFHPYGCGWHVDRRRFDRMLATCAEERGAMLFTGAHVSACEELGTEYVWRLQLNNKGQPLDIRAKAIIDATGRKAALAKWLGARRHVTDHLVGIVAAYAHSNDGGSYTLVEAVESGWWYSVDAPPDRTIVMFMTDADLCRPRALQEPGAFEAFLSQTTHSLVRVNRGKRLWGPVVFSAVSHLLRRTRPAPPWLAAGDAAMAVDPLSSSGVTGALEMGEAAAVAMLAGLKGDQHGVLSYEKWIQRLHATYTMQHRNYYSIETRWPRSAFWQRRVGPLADRSVRH